MRELHTEAMHWLEPKLGQLAAKTDAVTDLASRWRVQVDALAKGLADKTVAPFTRMANDLATANARAVVSLGLDVRGQLGPHLDDMREWNQNLMVNAGRAYADDVADVLNDPDNWGLAIDELTALLEERAGVSESRAELIARDQTAKTAASINQFRQQQAGVSEYDWSGSLDERERETHLANEGKRFAWNDPPAETGHPGDDIQCRCVAIPVISGLDDDDGGEGDDD